jgi:hypothetical protein
MKRRTVIRIVVGVVLFHAVAFAILSQMKPLPKTRYIPPPNFRYKEETYEDPKTGERTIWREIRVSTKLRDRESLKNEPPSTQP